jgi:hypothetical protein
VRSCILCWLGDESCLPRLCSGECGSHDNICVLGCWWASKSHLFSFGVLDMGVSISESMLSFALLGAPFRVLNPGARSLPICDPGPDMALQNLDV